MCADRSLRSLKTRALSFLSRREYSRAELARKLAPFVTPFVTEADASETLPGTLLNVLLDTLESEGWLCDARFAESLMHRRAQRYGAARILGELKHHALDEQLVERVSSTLRSSEEARAHAVWQKKFGAVPATPTERARQTRFLAMRGFSHAVIGKVLKGIGEAEDGDAWQGGESR